MSSVARRWRWVPLLAACAGGAIVPAAHADTYHYNNLLIGERAAGMGGAFTAVSDDPSGAYYNPAGLVYSFENYISLSANTYATASTVYKKVASSFDYRQSSKGLVPSFFGFSQNMGKTKVAFSVIVPNSDLIDQDDYLSGISSIEGGANILRRRLFIQDTTYLFGPSFSRSIGEKASWGISLFGASRTYKAIDNQLVTFNPSSTQTDPTSSRYFIQNTSIEGSAWALNPRLGLQWMPQERLALGLMVSKNLNLSGSYRRKELRTQSSGGAIVKPIGDYTSDLLSTESTGSFRMQGPWSATIGTAYFPSKSLLFSGDFSYYTEDSAFKEFKLASTWNAAAGTEWFVSQGLALRAGVFTNRANNAEPTVGVANQALHVNQLGGSLGFSFLKPGASFTVGTVYSRGNGKGQAVGDGTVQDVEQSQFAAYLSGSYQL